MTITIVTVTMTTRMPVMTIDSDAYDEGHDNDIVVYHVDYNII
jgi:hypothetical protein